MWQHITTRFQLHSLQPFLCIPMHRFHKSRTSSLFRKTLFLTAVALLALAVGRVPPARLLPAGLAQKAFAYLSEALPNAKLKMGGQVFHVDLAERPEDQSRGLGGRRKLEPNEGMLFIYRDEAKPAFWMHGMVISIDMLWIDNDRVVYIVHRAPPPAPGTPDEKLPLYEPTSPSNFVLEIAAGRAAALGVKVGDKVEFDFTGK
jgi:uncharacterized protein